MYAIRSYYELADGVGYGGTTEQGAQKFERRNDDDGLYRGHCPRGDDCCDDVGGIMKTIGVIEYQYNDDRDSYNFV